MLAAEMMYQEELADDAELLYQEVWKKWPQTPDVQFKLGLIALTRRNYRGGEHIKAEFAPDPAHPLGGQFLGEALDKAGKPNDAVDALQRAIWLNGRSTKLFVLLAQVHTEQGQLAIDENSPMHALAIEPQNYEVNFLLAKLYFKTNLPNLAKQRMESRKPAQERGRRQIGSQEIISLTTFPETSVSRKSLPL
jgi:predicted Zn-dependent protease